jgi:hypothetical protein
MERRNWSLVLLDERQWRGRISSSHALGFISRRFMKNRRQPELFHRRRRYIICKRGHHERRSGLRLVWRSKQNG